MKKNATLLYCNIFGELKSIGFVLDGNKLTKYNQTFELCISNGIYYFILCTRTAYDIRPWSTDKPHQNKLWLG